MSTMHGQQHSFSIHEWVFLRSCQNSWDGNCLDPIGLAPNLRIHAECSHITCCFSSSWPGIMIWSTGPQIIAVVTFLTFAYELKAAKVSFSTFVSINPKLESSMSLNCADIRHNSKAAASMQCLADPGSLTVSSRVTEQGDIMNQVCSCQTHPEEETLPVETAAKLLLPEFPAFRKGND